MIAYNPKDWFTFIFRFHKADTFRKLLPLMAGIAIYSGIVAYLEVEYFRVPPDSYLKNLPLMHNLLGFVISLLLVFRTNTAYDRWWEGRKQWGALTNTSRNLAMKLHAILPPEDHTIRAFFRRIIPVYAAALRAHLKPEAPMHWPDDEDPIDPALHRPNQIARRLVAKIYELRSDGRISAEQLLTLHTDIQAFTDICGACERIKNSPIPFSYSSFIKKFVFFYVMTLPFGYVFNLGYLVIPVVVFIFYVLASLELLAEEIEDPFGGDANDLPTDIITRNIEVHVGEILS